MSVDTGTELEPTRVYSPGEPLPTGRQRFYETYNTREVPIGGEDTGSSGPAPGPKPTRRQRAENTFRRTPGGNRRVPVPNGVPKFLGSPGIILVAWIAAMAMVSWDEWTTHHILPRPARLWYTSLTYFLLAVISTIDAAVPLATALAIGYTIAVAYQYFTGTGGFRLNASSTPATGGTAGSANPPSNPASSSPTTGGGANPGTPPSTGTVHKIGGHT